MAKRISSRQFVTVFVSLILSFDVKAADLRSPTSAASRNLPLVASLVSAQINTSEAWAVHNGSHNVAAQDLIGRTIATPILSTSHKSQPGTLKPWGLHARKVNVLNLNAAEIAAEWKRSEIDAVFR